MFAALSCQAVVKVLSPDDGRQGIVEAAQKLCRAVEQRERAIKDIDVNVLDSLLRGELDHTHTHILHLSPTLTHTHRRTHLTLTHTVFHLIVCNIGKADKSSVFI